MSHRRGVSAPPTLESLENRLALSAAVNANFVLVITGSPESELVTIEPGDEPGTAILTGVPGVANGAVFSGFEHVRVDLKSGDDIFLQTGQLANAVGFACNLTVLGGNGHDVATVEQDNASVSINGGNANDTVTDGGASATLRGGRGRDNLFGNDGHDEMHGGLGKDVMVGGGGNDTLNGGNQADEMWGNSGLDVLNGGPQRDALWGGGGPDQLTGGPARDRFNGSPGEALDFNAEDENFDALFDPERNVVLPSSVFWDRASEGETFDGLRLNLFIQDAIDAISDAAAQEATFARAFFMQWEALTANDRQSLGQALQGVTDAFSPDVVADPTALTNDDLIRLRDDLADAAEAANPGVAGSYARYMDAYVESLIAGGIVPRINQLAPGGLDTHGVLFGLDSIFNLAGDL